MANYSLIINSKFRPFEFEEMLKPVMIAEQAHREVEDAYTDLITKTNIWDKLTNAATDKKAHSLYSAYSKALEQEADRLAKQGLSPSSRQSLLNMRSRYAQDIVPIENAYKRKQAQIEEQRKAGNSMIYDYDASTISLDRFLENPALSYRSINRGDLYTRAVNDFSQYAKALQDYGNGKRLDQFTKTFVQRYGITPEDARSFIMSMREGRVDEANPTLRAVYDALYNSTGVNAWNNTQAQNTVRETILEGVGAAIGKSAVSPYEDRGAVMAQQLANSKELARYQSEPVTNPQNQDKLKMYDVNPTPYFSKDEVTRANNATAIELDKWKNKGYFTSSGKLTNRGLKMLRTAGGSKSQYIGTSPSIGMSIFTSTEKGDPKFLAWAKGHGVTGPNDSHIVSKVNKYYKDTRAAIASGELATGTANFKAYRQRLGKAAERNLIADNLFNIISNGVIYEAGQLSNGTITNGAPYDVNEFKKAIGYDGQLGTANILYIANAPTVGNAGQQFIELTNGKKFLIPNGEQFFGEQTYKDLQGANIKVRNAQSIAEVATNLNRANSYVATPLTTVEGTEIKPNDGTVTIDLLDLLDR